jgi:tetratricopeptide (TPR) repeat protein
MKLVYRSILIIYLLIIPCYLSVSQESQQMTFSKGSELFKAGKYQEALDHWLVLYKSGTRSASLDCNIGNAYFKLSNIPGAILYFERALLLKPADEDISYNLQIARTLVVDKFVAIPKIFFVSWYNFISLILSTNLWARISLTSFILFLLLFSLYIYSSRYRYKVIGFWVAIIMLLVSISSVSFSIRNRSLVFDNRQAIIFNPQVNGKSSPDNSGTDLFILHEGTKVTIEDGVGDWYEIRLSDGNKGWVPANCLEKL